MSLCKNCLQLFKEVWVIQTGDGAETQRFGLHSSAAAFMDAVDSGCYICLRLLQRQNVQDQIAVRKFAAAMQFFGNVQYAPVQSIRYTSNDKFLTTATFYPDHQAGESLKILVHINIYYSSKQAYPPSVCFGPLTKGGYLFDYVSGVPDQELDLFMVPVSSPQASHKYLPSNDTGSEETWSTIKEWIQNCASNHSQCIARRSHDLWYPSRLIKLDGFGGKASSDVTCKLVNGSDIAEAEDYVTLSHRWGASKVVKLTIANLESFYQSIPIQNLPITFVEAMESTSRLGIRLIWIDSLCIIQEGDNGKDWEHEASLMSKVYTNSFCNISADFSTGNKGLFQTRNPSLYKQLATTLRFSNIVAPGLERSEEYVTVESTIWRQQVSQSPLSSRGWVLQERLLTPRNIRFCKHEVFWECCEMVACETYPSGLPPSKMLTLGNDSRLKILKGSPEAVLPAQKRRAAHRLPDLPYYDAWGEIVEQYTTYQLTFPSDKLVAISGIARFMKPLVNDTYVLGFWLSKIAAQMMWFRPDYVITASDQAQLDLAGSSEAYRAPSFSWAAADCAILDLTPDMFGILPIVKCIYYRGEGHQTSDQDIEVREDIFGPIKGPLVELKVIGKLKRMTLKKEDGPYFDEPEVVPHGSPGVIKSDDKSRSYINAYIDRIYSLEDSPLKGQELYYVLWRDDEYEGEIDFSCLLLRLVDRTMARFARIGLLKTGLTTYREIYREAQEGEEDLPCWAYDSSEHLHTIYVV
ncbi:heterokaryon incompatibility protein-domain-containing protein [Xylariales sp. PMI_506]|nr:heterokaryon incompatibility protein-domain-containing protein [Xylariales sp. PMI_506]